MENDVDYYEEYYAYGLWTQSPAGSARGPDLRAACGNLNIKSLMLHLVFPLFSLVFVLGLLGNGVVVVILVKYRRLRIPANIYLLNLAVSDLLFILPLPFWFDYLVGQEGVLSQGMCVFLSGLYAVDLYSEALFITLLTVDRYVAIVHSVFALRVRTVTIAVISSLVTWCLAVLAALPEFLFHEIPENSFCIVYPADDNATGHNFHGLRVNILGLLLPLLVMAICYSGIVKTLLRIPNQRKRKAIRLIFAIVVVFYIFWTPYSLVILLLAFKDTVVRTCQHKENIDIAIMVTHLMALTHCCINPIIYAFVSEEFRKYMRHFFFAHLAVPLGRCLRILPTEKPERVSSFPQTHREF
ncbi:C-C chemokine receptor type 3-like [Ctenodactylus gundi]